MESNRQTGRTTRIVNFAVDQLFSVGEVIITDHTVFEYENVPLSAIKLFRERVEREVGFRSLGTIKIESNIDKVFGRSVLQFKVKI